MNETLNINVYADWLNTSEWQFYCTFTTRYSLTMKSARRAMERLHSHLTRYYGKVKMFWVAEPFDTKYSYHTHALLHFLDPLKFSFLRIREAWKIVSKGRGGVENNFTVVKPYDKKLGGHFYVSKYMHHFNSDFDIFI